APQLPQHDQADRDGEKPARQRAADPGDRERKLEPTDVDLVSTVGGIGRHRQHCGGVRAGRLEDDETEVDDARDPELKIEREAGDDVDGRVDHQRGRVVRVHPAAARAPRFASRPWGRSTITRTRIAKATTSLYSGAMAAAVSSVTIPMV